MVIINFVKRNNNNDNNNNNNNNNTVHRIKQWTRKIWTLNKNIFLRTSSTQR